MNMAHAGEAADLFDPQVLRQMLALQDPRMLADFYTLYLVQARELLDVFLPGAEVRLDRAVERLAHKLKSSSRSVGANPLGNILERVEQISRSGDPLALAEVVAQAREIAQQTFAVIAAHAESLLAHSKP
jgi:HPt (histidine-containing phosphotransfer) domain-containing protein